MRIDQPRGTTQPASEPLYTLLTPFPIVFFLATLTCDLVFWRSGNPLWMTATIWFLIAGLAIGAFAVVASLPGFAARHWLAAMRRAKAYVALAVVEAANLYLRLTAPELVLPVGMSLSAIAAGLLLFAGWQDGALDLRHRAGARTGARIGRQRL